MGVLIFEAIAVALIIVFCVFALMCGAKIWQLFFGAPAPSRKEVLAEFAGRLGWPLETDRDPVFEDRFPQFSAFRSGSSRYAYNQMQGVWPDERLSEPLDCRIGDYHYETTHTEMAQIGGATVPRTRTVHHHSSYVLVRLPYPCQGDLRVRPEGFLDRIGVFFGFNDIDYESAEFSKRFRVDSKDKRFAYDVFDPRMIEYFLDSKPNAFVLDGGWMCQTGGRWEPEEFEERLAWAAGFFAHWPRHLQSARSPVSRPKPEAT